MDNRVWVKDAVMTIRLPEEVDHFVADRLREEAGEILVERNVRERSEERFSRNAETDLT